MELMSQYDATIHYLLGDKNCAADTLSHLPDLALTTIAALLNPEGTWKIRTRFELEDAILEEIRTGYAEDPFTKKLISATPGIPNIHQEENFWFINNHLVVPNSKNIRETLFRLAHNQLGHFGLPKTYGSLQESYYWLNMQCDLEEGYIPGCPDCQRNKACTTKPIGLLYPLPVPDGHCDSVAMDFIGPLPKDNGYDMILTFTDCLGSDIRLVPTVSTLTVEQLAEIFFRHWYCENGLPLEIVSN
jgi:hypothetical protein